MNELIRFETFYTVEFALAASLFLYMTIAFVRWVVREMNVRTRPGRR